MDQLEELVSKATPTLKKAKATHPDSLLFVMAGDRLQERLKPFKVDSIAASKGDYALLPLPKAVAKKVAVETCTTTEEKLYTINALNHPPEGAFWVLFSVNGWHALIGIPNN